VFAYSKSTMSYYVHVLKCCSRVKMLTRLPWHVSERQRCSNSS